MKKSRILLLESAKNPAESLLLQLRMTGHETHSCYAPDDCVAAAKSLSPHVVVLNAGLPANGVYELSRILPRATDRRRPIVIAVSQPGDLIDHRRALDAGVEYHLVKPVTVAAWRDLLETRVP